MTHTVSIDDAGHVSVDGERLSAHFARRESQLLRIILSCTRPTSVETLFHNLYGGRWEPADIRIINVYICKLRKKLGIHAALIASERGYGYWRGLGYRLSAQEGRVMLEIDQALRDQLDRVAYEADRLPSDLASDLIRDGLKALSDKLWDRAA